MPYRDGERNGWCLMLTPALSSAVKNCLFIRETHCWLNVCCWFLHTYETPSKNKTALSERLFRVSSALTAAIRLSTGPLQCQSQGPVKSWDAFNEEKCLVFKAATGFVPYLRVIKASHFTVMLHWIQSTYFFLFVVILTADVGVVSCGLCSLCSLDMLTGSWFR